MKKSVTIFVLFLVMCVIICLQLVNHFVMFRETLNECVCSCNENSRETLVIRDVDAKTAHSKAVEHELREFDENLNEMLEFLGQMSDEQQSALGGNYERILQLLNTVKERGGAQRTQSVVVTNSRKQNGRDKEPKTVALGAEVQEICPEKFLGKSLTYGYPFFRKGFATLNCSQHIPVHELVTLVFDDLHTSSLYPLAYRRILQGLAKYHPKLKVVYITRDTPGDEEPLKPNVKVVSVQGVGKLGAAWSKGLTHVTTKYVLIAPHLVEFDDDINLKRLIRILSHYPDVAVASGAYRTRNGHWDIGCQQSGVLNYTLTLRGGYYTSHWECVVCDFTPGPWLARTKELNVLQFDKSLDFGVFHDIFWRLKKEKRISITCPDVMFNLDIPAVEDEQYLDFAKKYDIRKIVEPGGRVRWYGCRRGIKHRQSRSCSKPRGLGVPPCDLENLADAIKLIMGECEKAGLFCELQEGTLLGAVKFNKVLPWERDADLTFLTANYTALKALGPVFKAAGYSFSAHDSSVWCCADGRKAGGKFSLHADGWSIEMYGQHLMESEILVARGEKPTKVDFAGQLVTVMRNPGLFARNRYGKDIYRHQEHWLDRGKTSGWQFYEPGVFEGCPSEGHSGCLSQYSTDGNMQFDMNICPCNMQKPAR